MNTEVQEVKTGYDTDLTAKHIEEKGNKQASNWVDNQNAEYTLYKLSDPVGDHDTIHAVIKTNREYNPKTDTKTETKQIHKMGTLTLGPIQEPQIKFPHTIPNVDTTTETLYQTSTIENIREYTKHQAKRIIDKGLNSEHIFKHTSLSITENTITITLRLQKYTKMAYQNSTFPDTITQKEATTILKNTLYDQNQQDKHTISFTFPFTLTITTWQLKALEYQHLGLFKNKPAVATVKAISKRNPHHTQKEIANIIGTHPSTISRQQDTITDLEKRSKWHTNNS